jgi:hypothetical protein
MQEIADWLGKLGMSEYAERFAENRIDPSALPDLTDQHLKDLGIALGDRLKMLHAIRELGGTAPATPQPSVTQDTAERRQLTVMFYDLVGSDQPCRLGSTPKTAGHHRWLSPAVRRGDRQIRWVRRQAFHLKETPSSSMAMKRIRRYSRYPGERGDLGGEDAESVDRLVAL